MYFYKVLIAILCSFFSIVSFSQNLINLDQFAKEKVIKEGATNDLYFLFRKSTEKEKLSNKSIDLSTFKDAQFLDYSNNLFNVKACYQAKLDEVQILFNDEIYVLYPHKIQAIQIKDRLFSPQFIKNNI